MNPSLVLLLVAVAVSAAGAMPSGAGLSDVGPGKYFPCNVEDEDGEMEVDCPFFNMPSLVRQAFERNAPNAGITKLHIHSDIEGTVTDYLADNDLLSGSYGTITEFLSAYSISTGFPHLLSKLTALEHLHIENTNIGNVAAGMLNLATPEAMRRMTISYCPLYNFEAHAFPAGFKSNLRLVHNNLTALNGAAFQPILAAGSKLEFDSNGVPCDCALSWLVRDNRHLLDQVWGKCRKDYGVLVDLREADVTDWNDCP